MIVIYPRKQDLQQWKELIIEYGFVYRPPMSERWVDNMFSAFEVVKLHPNHQENFALAAAHLFYKIAKNHREPDGNKRSAIICLTLFSILNNKELKISADLIEFIALLTAGHPKEATAYITSLLEMTFEERITDR